MCFKNRRPLRRNLPRPTRLLPAFPRAPTHDAQALGDKRRHPRAAYPRAIHTAIRLTLCAHAAIRRYPPYRGATNAIPRAHYYALAPKRRHPNADHSAYAHAIPTPNLSSPRRRLHANKRRQIPRLRPARKRRSHLLGR